MLCASRESLYLPVIETEMRYQGEIFLSFLNLYLCDYSYFDCDLRLSNFIVIPLFITKTKLVAKFFLSPLMEKEEQF